MKYDYYEVSVPTELGKNDKERGQLAIDEAKEKAKLYCIPALWTAQKIRKNWFETTFKVIRKHN